jgi:hypothetical protein
MSSRALPRPRLPSFFPSCGAALLLAAIPAAGWGVEPEAPSEDDQRWERAEHLELARAHATTLGELDAGRAGEADVRARAELGFMASEVARELVRQLRLARTIYDGDGLRATLLPPGPRELELLGSANARERWVLSCGPDGEPAASPHGYLEYLERVPGGSSAAEALWLAHVEPVCTEAAPAGIAARQERLARYELFLTHFPYHALAPRARERRNQLLSELSQELGSPTPDPVRALVEREGADAPPPSGPPRVLWRIGVDLDGDQVRDLALAVAPETGSPDHWLVALHKQGAYVFVGSFSLRGGELRHAVPTPGIGWLRAQGPCTTELCEPPLTYQISDRGVRPVLDFGLPKSADRLGLDRVAESQLALPASLLSAEACALAPERPIARCNWKAAALPPQGAHTPASPGR